MKKVARKFFLPIILGSVLIFAIETAQVNASDKFYANYNVMQTSSIVQLENDAFWDKFRESVMKDKDKNNEDPDQSPGNEEQPQNDIGKSVKHSRSLSYFR